ncbi:MAG TPA: CPBP family intramembrane glutamic endopeptidase [Myxococcales bacterium]|nr:CPBP family intramembrane glutamic endopeptidase [Myxococcales bacterium]
MTRPGWDPDSRRALILFFALVALICGAFDFFAIHYRTGSFKVMWGVGISALLTLWLLKRDVRSLGWGFGEWRWQWLAFALPMGYCLVAYGIIWSAGFGGFYDAAFVARVRDGNGFAGWSDGAVLAWFVSTTAVFGMPGSLSSALGEEIGWRGFLVPELAKGLPFTAVALISGLVWGAWHLPLILLGSYHNNSPAALPLYGQLAMFFIGVVSAAVIMAWLRLKSGSLWTAAIFHASHNLAVQAICNPLTIAHAQTPKYVDELGLVLPLTMVPLAVWFFLRGRRELSGRESDPLRGRASARSERLEQVGGG